MSASGGGGGQPLSILFKILGINEAKAALSALVPEVGKIGSAADAAGKKVGVIADSVKKTGSASSGLKPISDNLNKIDTSATKAAGSTTKVQGAMDKSKTAVTGFTAASNQSSASVTKLSTGHEQLASTGTKVADSQGKVSKSTGDVKVSADAASGSVIKVAKSQDDLSTSSGKTSGSLDKQKGSLKGVTDESKGAEGGLTKVKGATDQVGGSSEQASTKQGTLRSSFASTMGAAASLGGGITSLWQTYDSLSDAQLRVDKATNTLHTTQTKIQSLQIQLNKLTADGKEGTDQYRLVQEKLNIANDKLVASEGTLQNAQEDLNITQAQFYQRIIPETITVLGSMSTLLSNSGGLLGKFKDGLSNLSIESLKTSKVLSLISLSNPFFIALTVGGGIVAAFATNLFGFRDAINSVGVAIGNALGPLKPFLTMIGSLGEGLVNALGMGGDATKQYAADTTESMDTATGAVEGHKTAVVDWATQNNQTLVRADAAAAGFSTDFISNMQSAGGAMPGLSDSVGTAVGTSIQHMDNLIKKSEETSAKMGMAFKKNVDLGGGATLSGVSEKAPPTSPVSSQIAGSMGVGKEMLSGPWERLTKVMTQFDPVAQKTFFSLQQLKTEAKNAGLSSADYNSVLTYLTKSLDYEAVSGTKVVNVSSALADAVKRQRDIQAESNKIIQEGGKWHAYTSKELGNESKASKLATGTTQALSNALSDVSEGSEATVGSTKKLVGGQKVLQDMFGSLSDDSVAYNEILHSQSMMHDLVAGGVKRQQVAMQKAVIDVIANTAASGEYTKQLSTQRGQSVEVAQGILKQNDAFNQAKASMLQNAGALVVLSDSTKMADAKNVAFADGIFKTVIAIKNQQIATEETRGEIAALIAEQIRGEAQTTAYNKGFYDQEKQFQLNKIAIFETQGKLEAMHLEYQSGEAQILAYNKGILAQQEAFEQDKLKANELQGTIAELNAEGRSGQAQIVAFNNAFFEQELAFTKSKTSADALRGTVAAMRKEYNVASVIAFTAAFEDQNKKFEDDKLAVDALGGTILSLKAHMETGEATVMNFNKGMREQEIAFLNSISAIDQEEGAIASLISHLNDGTAQTVAFNKGMYDQRKAVLESITTVEQLAGSVSEYATAVDSGLPSIVSFNTGVLNQKKSMLDMRVATAGTLGTIRELTSQLTDTNAIITRYNSGFAEGNKSILEWANGIASARGAASGAQSAFNSLAGSLGETLPEGFNASLDAQKDFVEGMQGLPSKVQGVIDKMSQSAQEIGSSLSEGFSKGSKELDNVFAGMGEKLGFELDSEMQSAFNAAEIASQLKSKLEAGFKALSSVDINMPGAFAKIANGVISQIGDAIAHDPRLATMGKPIIDTLEKLKLSPASTQLWTQLEGYINNFKSNATTAAAVQKNLTAEMGNPEGANKMVANLGTGIQALQKYQGAIAATQKVVQNYQQILGHMWDNAIGPSGQTGLGELGEKLKGTSADKSTPAPKGGTDPFAAQMASAEAFKAKLTEIQTLAQTTATNITTAFTTMGTAFGTTVTTMSAAAGAGATIIGGALAKGFQVAGTYITTLSSNFGSQITAMGSAAAAGAIIIGVSFGKGFQEAQKFATTSIQSMTKMIQGFPITVRQPILQTATLIATGFQQGEKFANTSLQAILRMATLSLGKIGPAAQTAGRAIGNGIAAGANQASSALSSMASRASSAFNSIVSSANRARSSVQSLASAINSLRSKTITITTVYRQVIQRVYAAKGFGPAIVNSPMNLTVGENGPEMVNVIPMSSSAPNNTRSTINMPTSTMTTNNRTNSTSTLSRSIANNIIGGNNINSSSSSSSSQQNSVINRFNESVSRISNTFDKQESRMVSSNIQNISSVRNSGGYSSNTGATNYNTTNVPNISSVRNSNVYNSGGGTGTGGGPVEGIVAMVKDIITSAFAQTTINVTSQSIMDSDLVYEKQKKQFGLRNGAVLK